MRVLEAQTPVSVVGLTGPNAAGKGEVANILLARGYVYHSLSDVVREEATRRGLDHTRENLIRVGNELRAAHGPGVLAERIVATIVGAGGSAAPREEAAPGPSTWLIRVPEGVNAIVDSIRNPAEVAVLRRLSGFVLIGVNAPIALRFDRSRKRARAGDGTTLEEFARKENLENSTDPAAQQLTQTFLLADVVIDNAGTLADLADHVAAAVPPA